MRKLGGFRRQRQRKATTNALGASETARVTDL